MSGDPPTTIIGAASRAAEKLIGILPPAFLLLIALNIAFIWLTMSFINGQMAQRTEMANKLLNACIELDNFELDAIRRSQKEH